MITVDEIERDEESINSFIEVLLASLGHNVSNVTLDRHRIEVIKDDLKQLNRTLSYYAKMERTEHNIHFARGRLVGIYEIYQKLIALSQSVENHSHAIDDVFAIIKTVSHGEEVLESLSLSRGVNHKELSDIIGVDVSTLTGIMDKLEKLNLIYYTKIGKFKFYYLSDLGQSYKDEKKAQPQMYIKELELQLQKERERSRLRERPKVVITDDDRVKTGSKKQKYNQHISADKNRISDRDRSLKKAQKVLDGWGRENALKPSSNKCEDLI